MSEIEQAKQNAETVESFVERVTDARKALDICASTYKKEWAEWTEASGTMLSDMRGWRMAMDTEMANTLGKFRDLRKFFLSDEHNIEVARLKEFVELCERLKVLKDGGFLDRVTDTILRLEVK